VTELPVLQHLAPKEPSDFREAMPLVDVWRSATAISGVQCVMTCGALLMPMWLADSWDSGKTQVIVQGFLQDGMCT
jgi:hypothetical protein